MYARSLSVLSVFRVGEKARNVGAATPLDRGETEASSSWGRIREVLCFRVRSVFTSRAVGWILKDLFNCELFLFVVRRGEVL